MRFDEIRDIALSFPEVEEYDLFGTPAYRIRKRLLVCRAKVADDTVMLKVPSKLEREFLLSSQSDIYWMDAHYENYDCLLVRVPLMDAGEFRELFEAAWRTYAPKKVLAAYQAEESQDD
jgi:hypothetical protein